MIQEADKIGVLNYNENRVSVEVAPGKHYGFEPSPDGINPTVILMTLDEIRYINNTNAFRSGMLFFDKRREEEVYNELNITDWKNILTNDDIREIILHPTYEGLSRIIAIKNSSEFERVRTVLHKLKSDNNCDISVRVSQIVSTRYKELAKRQIYTSIELTKKDIPDVADNEIVDELKNQNAAMQEQIEQMKKMIENMNNGLKPTGTSNNNDTKKSVPRQKKNS